MQRRSEFVELRLYSSQRALLDSLASDLGCTRTSLLLRPVYGNETLVDVRKDGIATLRTTRAELIKQGVNYRQIQDACLVSAAAGGDIEAFLDEQDKIETRRFMDEELVRLAMIALREKVSWRKGKDNRFLLRLTKDEKGKLRELAQASDMTSSGYLIAGLMNREVGVSEIRESLAVIKGLLPNLIRHGREYNLIAHSFNQAALSRRRENVAPYLISQDSTEVDRYQDLIKLGGLLEDVVGWLT